MLRLTADEANCIRILASWFEAGETELDGENARQRLALSWEKFNPLMRKMQDFGAIRIRLEAEGTVDVFVILARTVQLARELDAADRAAPEPPDFVEQIHKRLRANPVWGWIIVVVLALAVFCGLIADIVTVLNSIGCAPTAP